MASLPGYFSRQKRGGDSEPITTCDRSQKCEKSSKGFHFFFNCFFFQLEPKPVLKIRF